MKITVLHNRMKNNSIEVRINIALGKYVYKSTGLFVDSKNWDKENEMVVGIPKADEYNTKIQQFRDMFLEVYKRCTSEMGSKFITVGFFRNRMVEYEGSLDDSKSFFRWALQEVRKMKNLQKTTKKSYITSLKVASKLKRIKIGDIDKFASSDLAEKLIDHYGSLNSAKKTLTIVKTMARRAYTKGIIHFDEFESFNAVNIKGQQTHKDVLNEIEIKDIENLMIEDDEKNMIKDMFVFSVYTALRYSDVSTLKVKDITYDLGEMIMRKSVYKLKNINRSVRMNLTRLFNGNPERLIKKYITGKKKNDFVFGKVDIRLLLDTLDEIAEELDIDKKITFHVARHTSLTMVAKKTGDVFEVMMHGGISSTSTAMRYIHLSEDMFERKFEKITW